jgi:hypothetical protein
MEKYELLVKQFNELVDKINAYESLIEKQQKDSLEKLNLMKDLFQEQQKGFDELRNATAFYESIFRENYENIVDVLSNKLINIIMQMTDKKLLEVQNAVTPVKEEFIKTNITLESIRDESIFLEKKLEKINIIEEKLSIILDSLSKNTPSSKNDLGDNGEKHHIKEYGFDKSKSKQSVNKIKNSEKENFPVQSTHDESYLDNIEDDSIINKINDQSENSKKSGNLDDSSIDIGTFIENCRVKLFQYVLYSGKKFDIKKIDSIFNTFLSSCIQAKSVLEINDYYLQAKLKLEYIFEG